MSIKNDIEKLIHRGTGGQQGWIYSPDGIISTIPASTYKDPIKIVVKEDIIEYKQDNSDREHDQ